MKQPVLEIRGLDVDYGLGDQAVHAVRSANLTLHRGEVLGLAGESGSGKSTLAYGITRLLPPPGLIAGGSVLGGTFYGTYPTLRLGGPDDTDGGSSPRGRWIPTTSVEQYAATLANWYGLSSADLTAVFPLISRFATSNLGFLS